VCVRRVKEKECLCVRVCVCVASKIDGEWSVRELECVCVCGERRRKSVR